MVLTVILRPAIPGLVPLAIVNAPVAGTGKTLLSNISAQIATGRPAALTAAPTRDDEELRKRITSILLSGQTNIVFDNLNATLESSVLAQALTGEVWSDRVLGGSRMVELPQRATWCATGNNVELGGDLARRCFWIDLDPRMAQPWQRTFRRADLAGWVLANRGRLLGAGLTLGRAWFARDRPAGQAPTWGTFQGWADMMAGILGTARVPGFLANLNAVHGAADVEATGWHRVLRFWRSQSAMPRSGWRNSPTACGLTVWTWTFHPRSRTPWAT